MRFRGRAACEPKLLLALSARDRAGSPLFSTRSLRRKSVVDLQADRKSQRASDWQTDDDRN